VPSFGFRRRRSDHASDQRDAVPPDGVDVVGYGMGFRPVPVFEVGRLPSASTTDTLIFAHLRNGGAAANLLVEPGQSSPSGPLQRRRQEGPASEQGGWAYQDGPNGPSVHVGQNVDDPREVAIPVPGCGDRAWFLRTRGYEVEWPDGWSLSSTQPGSAWPFELNLPDQAADALVIVRGPLAKEAVPAPDALVAPGQRMVDMQATDQTLWVEVAYSVNGADWRQRHELAAVDDRVLLVTGQAPAEQARAVAEACSVLALSARPTSSLAATPFSLADRPA
jgi:hypothetical protein